MKGWIKLHRKFLEWEWFTDANTFRLFLYLLLKANHEEQKWKGHRVKQGQLITGLFTLSEDLGMGVQSIRTSLIKLKSTNEITIKSNSKYSLITILNWNKYQDTNKQTNKPLTNDQQTTNNKQELKNDKKYPMSWKEQKEPEIDIDSNEPIIEPEKKVKESDVRWFFSFFKENPAYLSWLKIPAQRGAAERLIISQGKEKIKNAIAYAQLIKGEPFASEIDSPYELEQKWVKLQRHRNKHG